MNRGTKSQKLGRLQIILILLLCNVLVYFLSSRLLWLTALIGMGLGLFIGFPLMWQQHGLWSAYALVILHFLGLALVLLYYGVFAFHILGDWGAWVRSDILTMDFLRQALLKKAKIQKQSDGQMGL